MPSNSGQAGQWVPYNYSYQTVKTAASQGVHTPADGLQEAAKNVIKWYLGVAQTLDQDTQDLFEYLRDAVGEDVASAPVLSPGDTITVKVNAGPPPPKPPKPLVWDYSVKCPKYALYSGEQVDAGDAVINCASCGPFYHCNTCKDTGKVYQWYCGCDTGKQLKQSDDNEVPF